MGREGNRRPRSRSIHGLWIWAVNRVILSVLILVGNCKNLWISLSPPNCLLKNSFSEDWNNLILTWREGFDPGFSKTSIRSYKTNSLFLLYSALTVYLPFSLFWIEDLKQTAFFLIGRFGLLKCNSRSSITTTIMMHTTFIISP